MKVIDIARNYLGIQETGNNKFVEDNDKTNDATEFAALVHKAGQKDGESWCCYAMEVVFCLAFPHLDGLLRKLFSSNCLQTWINFLQSGRFKVYRRPVVGGLCIFVNVKGGVIQTTGHATLCIEIISLTQFKTFEGNTNVKGSSNGDRFMEKTRDTIERDDDLMFIGCIVIE